MRLPVGIPVSSVVALSAARALWASSSLVSALSCSVFADEKNLRSSHTTVNVQVLLRPPIGRVVSQPIVANAWSIV